jgi:UDP-GlcNAc:undecaprenyl-phosphate GlcNAc-1-phosphate transferase
MRTYLGLFVLALLFTFLLTPRVGAFGRRVRAFGKGPDGRDHPEVPRLGGIAIFLATLATWSALLLIPNDMRARFLAEWRTLMTVLVPGTLVLLAGAYDDMRGATPRQKLLVEVVAAGMVWLAGFRILRLPFFGLPIGSLLSLVLTVFWIVAVTNSLNLIDGLDGLAGGIAFFVTISVFVVSLLQGNYFVCILAISLAGALLAFLRFNFAPATIYLGDSGSLFLGFVLASLAVHTSQKSSTLLAIVVPFVAFGLPLMDTSLAVLRRFLSGRPLFQPDRDHIHHRLLQNKLTLKVVVLGLYGLAALFSLGSLAILQSTGSLVALVAVLAGASAWFLTGGLRYDELSELNVYVTRAVQSQRRVLANQILIRKAAKQLEEAASLEECWGMLANTLEALDFDAVTCQFSKWPYAPAPALAEWSRFNHVISENRWHVSIPLRVNEKVVGNLQLYRELAKDRLLFQFSSLLDTLMPSLESQLKRRAEAQEQEFAKERRPVAPPALQQSLLSSEREG